MKRNSTILYIQSPGATTPIPWVNDAPDFSGFTEPTLSVLQKTWQIFLDSEEELEIVPDPEPVVEAPQPDWDGLYGGLMSSNTYQTILLTSLSLPNLSAALGVVIDSIQYGIIKPDSSVAIPAFQSAINVLLVTLQNIGQSLSTENLAEVREILDGNGFADIVIN